LIGITAKSADFVSGIGFADLPPRSIVAATMGFVDCIGVMIAGSREEAVRIVAAMAATGQPSDGAIEIPSGRHLSAPDAALVNGVAAHVLDYDDVAMAAHPSAALVPAILAEGYAQKASGREAITAYAAGYELWAQLVALEPGRLHVRGFHPTAVFGTLAAAAACARLRRLDPEKTLHALGIAASMASGLVANFGSMTKSLHAGRAAQAGVLAARLADRGFTASPDIFEHRTGFLRAFSPSGEPRIEADVIDLGVNWRLAARGVDIKRYPTCYATHRCIDAMLELAQTHDLNPDQVSKINVRTGEAQLLLLRNPAPRTALEAKFSMEFAMSAALIARSVGLNQLTDDFVARPDVNAAFSRVHCTTTGEMMSGDELFAPDDRVSVTLKSGDVLDHSPIVYAKGSWQRPLTRGELGSKFRDCTAGILPRDQGSVLFEQLWDLQSLDSFRSLAIGAA
jgi:2-methylcitrate dehydratase PrpD